MSADTLPLLDSLSALADPTRCRMLWLLDRQELTVTELCAILQLPQSTVSRQLKTLADANWLSSRRDGTSRYYAVDRRETAHAQLWELTKQQLAGRPGVEQDARRLARVMARRRETSEQFFATSAGEWDRLREEMFGRAFVPAALVGLLPRDWVMGDLGCGTGAMLPVLAPHVARVIGVDASEEMLAAARARASHLPNVELRAGVLESLPLENDSLDAATLMLVLHHLASPVDALREAARVLVPGGRLLIVDMAPHEHEEYRQQMGHVWLGFSESQTQHLLAQAGFDAIRIHPLAPDADAKGPGLFAATAAKRNVGRTGLRSASTSRPADQAALRRRESNVYRRLHRTCLRRRPQGGASTVQGRRSGAGRMGPQGDAPRRAGDARPDGAPRALRPHEAARGRARDGLAPHDDSDGGADRDARRPRRRRALGVVQHLLDAGSRGVGRRGRAP